MKSILFLSCLSLASITVATTPLQATASPFEDSWEFVCQWDCGITDFEPEYGGHTVHGYSATFFDSLPSSQDEARQWAYHDFWVPAGCHTLSSFFARTVCFDTAFLHGVSDWLHFWSLYQFHPDDLLACHVIAERSSARNPNSPYIEGWANRDSALAALGNCNI